MSATENNLSHAVGKEASDELTNALRKIDHCVHQLSHDQLWWRPSESMNSIANLLLHLSGNLRQWVISGIGGVADVRVRQQEFNERSSATKTELMQQIEETVAEAKETLMDLSAEELLRDRRIQGFDVSGIQAIFESVAHFRGHTQEIIHMTRCQLGDSYEIDFVPSTPEQGAPLE